MWSSFASRFVTFNLVCFGLLLFSGRLDSNFVSLGQPTVSAMSFNESIGCSSSDVTLPPGSEIQTDGALLLYNNEVITVSAGAPFSLKINAGSPVITVILLTHSFVVLTAGAHTPSASTYPDP